MATMNGANEHRTPDQTADQLARFERLVGNVLGMRGEMFNRFMNPDRDIDRDCNYPNVLEAEFYRTLYDRTGIAERVVQMMPKECWRVVPKVYEDESAKNATPFEAAWDNLGRSLQGHKSWYKDEEGSLLWTYMVRADILSGIGVFGVMLLGLNDGKLLEQPADGVDPDGQAKDITGIGDLQSKDIYGGQILQQPLSSTMGTDAQYFQTQFSPMQRPQKGKGDKELLFLRVFDESLVQVVQYEASMFSPRFGQPIMYRITLNDPRQPHTGIGLPLATVRVHWSRVIHIAENSDVCSEIFAKPRQRPVVNNILDLRKLYGGSAEMYWRGAFPGLSIETVPQLGGDVMVNHGQLRDMMEDYHNSLQRWIGLMGMSAKSLAPQVSDPSPQIASQLEAIGIEMGCPVRVLKGSERGELASSQDDSDWNERVAHRENFYLTPKMIAPVADRLILLGVLPAPGGPKKAEPGTKTRGGAKLPTDPGGPNPKVTGNAFPPSGAPKAPPGSPKSTVPGTPPPAPPKPQKIKYGRDDNEAGFHVEWPDLDSNTDTQKATIALTETQAMGAYISGGVEAMLTQQDFLVRVLGWTEEEAEAALADAEDAMEDKQDEAQDLADEHGFVPTPPDGFEKKPPPPPPMPPGVPIKVKPGEKLVHPASVQPPVGAAKQPTPPAQNAFTVNLASPAERVQDVVDGYTEEDLDGIRVMYDEDDDSVWLDVMDWGDPGLGRYLEKAFKAIVGDDNVTRVNEGAAPQGDNWITVNAGNPNHDAKGKFSSRPSSEFGLPPASDDPLPGGQHYYHSTPHSNLAGIEKNGLMPTGVEGFKRTSLAPHLDSTHFWNESAGESSQGNIQLRMQRKNVKGKPAVVEGDEDEDEGDYEETAEHTTKQTVPVHHLEVYHQGKWKPLAGGVKNEAVDNAWDPDLHPRNPDGKFLTGKARIAVVTQIKAAKGEVYPVPKPPKAPKTSATATRAARSSAPKSEKGGVPSVDDMHAHVTALKASGNATIKDLTDTVAKIGLMPKTAILELHARLESSASKSGTKGELSLKLYNAAMNVPVEKVADVEARKLAPLKQRLQMVQEREAKGGVPFTDVLHQHLTAAGRVNVDAKTMYQDFRRQAEGLAPLNSNVTHAYLEASLKGIGPDVGRLTAGEFMKIVPHVPYGEGHANDLASYTRSKQIPADALAKSGLPGVTKLEKVKAESATYGVLPPEGRAKPDGTMAPKGPPSLGERLDRIARTELAKGMPFADAVVTAVKAQSPSLVNSPPHAIMADVKRMGRGEEPLDPNFRRDHVKAALAVVSQDHGKLGVGEFLRAAQHMNYAEIPKNVRGQDPATALRNRMMPDDIIGKMGATAPSGRTKAVSEPTPQPKPTLPPSPQKAEPVKTQASVPDHTTNPAKVAEAARESIPQPRFQPSLAAPEPIAAPAPLSKAATYTHDILKQELGDRNYPVSIHRIKTASGLSLDDLHGALKELHGAGKVTFGSKDRNRTLGEERSAIRQQSGSDLHMVSMREAE